MSKVFLYMFNTAVMAGWLVLAVLIVRLLLKKAPAWVKCGLWAIVALRLIWPFQISSIVSLIPSAQTLPVGELYHYEPQLHTGIPVLNSAINPGFTQVFLSEPANSINPLQVATELAGWVWIFGMVAMAFYAGFSYLRLRKLVRVSMPVEEGVYLCDSISSPFILGIFRPRIYLPSVVDKEQWPMIIAHEKAHLSRRDHWWKPLGFLLLTVFWLHPLLWLGYILLCRDVEMACDEKVIRTLSDGEKQRYSQILLECSMPKKWITACPLAFGEVGVKERVKNVLHYKKPTLWILIAALLIGGVLAVCFLTEPADPKETQTNAPFQVAGKSYVYEKEGAGGAFTMTINTDGTFSYYAGLFSSYFGHGNWELQNDKLYLYDKGLSKTQIFVFRVENGALVFLAQESDHFIYVDVADGDRFHYYADTAYARQQLIFVTVTEIRETDFLAKDIMGNTWCIRFEPDSFMNAAPLWDQCWVNFIGQPQTDADGVRHIAAADYWYYNSSLTDGRQTFDICSFDVDGDGKKEWCHLTADPASEDLRCVLTMQNGETVKYIVHLPVAVPAGQNVGFAFVEENGELFILSNSGQHYAETGEFLAYKVSFADGKLTVTEQ